MLKQVTTEDERYKEIQKKRIYYKETVICSNCRSDLMWKCGCTSLYTGGMDGYPVELVPRIYIGSSLYLGNNEFMKEKNIGYILNCANSGLMKYVKKKHIIQLSLDGLDEENYDIIGELGERALSYVREALDSSDKSIYINCKMGINRSAVISGYVIWSLNYKLSMEEVIEKIIEKRPICFSNNYFIRHLLYIGDTEDRYKSLRRDEEKNMVYEVYIESKEGIMYPISSSRSQFLNYIKPRRGAKLKLYSYIKYSIEELIESLNILNKLEVYINKCRGLKGGLEELIIEDIRGIDMENSIVKLLDIKITDEEKELMRYMRGEMVERNELIERYEERTII